MRVRRRSQGWGEASRRCLAIRLQLRRQHQRPALVRSYERPMSTTNSVLRKAATTVRRLGQRVRIAPVTTAARLRRLQHRLQDLRPILARVLDHTGARVIDGDTPCARQGAERV